MVEKKEDMRAYVKAINAACRYACSSFSEVLISISKLYSCDYRLRSASSCDSPKTYVNSSHRHARRPSSRNVKYPISRKSIRQSPRNDMSAYTWLPDDNLVALPYGGHRTYVHICALIDNGGPSGAARPTFLGVLNGTFSSHKNQACY